MGCETHKKDTTYVVSFLWKGRLKSIFQSFKIPCVQGHHLTGLLAGAAFAAYKRFRRRRKPWRRRNSFPPSIWITGGWSGPTACGTQKERHAFSVSFFLNCRYDSDIFHTHRSRSHCNGAQLNRRAYAPQFISVFGISALIPSAAARKGHWIWNPDTWGSKFINCICE